MPRNTKDVDGVPLSQGSYNSKPAGAVGHRHRSGYEHGMSSHGWHQRDADGEAERPDQGAWRQPLPETGQRWTQVLGLYGRWMKILSGSRLAAESSIRTSVRSHFTLAEATTETSKNHIAGKTGLGLPSRSNAGLAPARSVSAWVAAPSSNTWQGLGAAPCQLWCFSLVGSGAGSDVPPRDGKRRMDFRFTPMRAAFHKEVQAFIDQLLPKTDWCRPDGHNEQGERLHQFDLQGKEALAAKGWTGVALADEVRRQEAPMMKRSYWSRSSSTGGVPYWPISAALMTGDMILQFGRRAEAEVRPPIAARGAVVRGA